jgi:hypothetical protein
MADIVLRFRSLSLWFSGVAAIAIAIAMATSMSAVAQPITGIEAQRSIRAAEVLSVEIRGFHRGPGIWIGRTPPPRNYCRVMAAGEFALKELARIEARALQYRQNGLVSRLEAVGDELSDELDVEEMINDEAGMTYSEFPCPAATSPFAARARLLAPIERRMPACRRQANAVQVSFAARRDVMQHCLHLPSGPFTELKPALCDVTADQELFRCARGLSTRYLGVAFRPVFDKSVALIVASIL